ncbi:MAG: sensor histidine kinase [Sphingobacteriaceae bacterium]
MMDKSHMALQNLETITKKLQSVERENNTLRQEINSLRSFIQRSATHGAGIQKNFLNGATNANENISQKNNEHIIIPRIIHDIKNPLHNIKLSSDLVKKSIDKSVGLEADIKHRCLVWLKIITDSCEKAFVFLQDILLMEEIESESLIFNKEVIAIDSLISNNLPHLISQAAAKDISIDFSYPEDRQLVEINNKYFITAINKLIHNAIKFTFSGGHIQMILKENEGKVILQISDNGIGIPPELRANIYHKFTRSSRLGTDEETSKGVGLYIAKKIIDLHQGKLWLETEDQKGSTFFIVLNKVDLEKV